MKCEEFSRMLDNYENLTAEEKLSMNEHMEKCEKCRNEFDFMMGIIANLRTLPKIQPPEDFIDKLNERLDMEEPAKTDGTFYVIRRHYKQLSTVAACLLIAVVIGANGKLLLNHMPADTGNDGDSAIAVSTTEPLMEKTQTTDSNSSEQPKPAVDVSQPQNKAVSGAAQETASRQTMQTAALVPSIPTRRIEPIREMSESINMIEQPDTSNVVSPRMANDPAGSVAADTGNTNAGSMGRMAEAPAVASAQGNVEIKDNSKFKIARGIYYLPDQNGVPAQSTPQPTEDDYRVKINKNKDIEIARGVYYIKTNDGYVNTRNNEIEIDSNDAQRALELIEQYIDETESEYYVINTENITPMLEHMEREGINYQHSIEEEVNERVGFKVKID